MRRLFLILLFWGTMPLFFIDPFYGIVHYSLINIIRPEQLLWGGGVGRIFLASQVFTAIAWFVKKDELTPEDTPIPHQIKVMIVIAIAMIIATIFAIASREASWFWTVKMIKTIVPFCFLMAKSINSAKKLERYYAVSIIWFMLLAIWGIQQKLSGNTRIEGIGGAQLNDSNALSAVFVLYFPMAYYSMFSRTKWVKFFIGIPGIIVFTIFILFGGSRGAFLGMSVCMLSIFLGTKGTQKIKMAFVLIVVGTLLAATLSVLAPEGFFDEYKARLATILGEEEEETGQIEHEASAAGRIAMWKASFHVFRQHPEFWLTGVGLKGFDAIYFNYIDEIEPHLDLDEVHYVYFGGSGGKALHNGFINIATGGGIIVFLPWMYLIFYSLFQAHNIPRKYPRIVDGVDIHNYARSIEIGIVGFCVTMLFLNADLYDFFYWHMTMAGIIANLGKAKLEREALGQEDEEFTETSIRRPVYSPSLY